MMFSDLEALKQIGPHNILFPTVDNKEIKIDTKLFKGVKEATFP
jgi:hypothetical protein